MTHHPSRSDLGPRGPLQRGERIEEFGPDPDRPNATVKRSRASWLPLEMHQRGTLSRDALNAAITFRDDWEMSQGARDGLPERLQDVRADGASGRCPTQAALDAQARVRRAIQAIGKTGSVCLSLCVARGATLRQLALTLGHREQAASGYLIGVLDRLAEHYAKEGR